MPTVSPSVEVIEGQTPSGLPAGTLLNLYDACNLASVGVTDPMVRTVMVQGHEDNSGDIKVGYRVTDPKNPAPLGFDAIEGKWYDLRYVVVKLGSTGDKAIFIASR